MIDSIKKGVIVMADSPQTGFVNIYEDPSKNPSTTLLKVDNGGVVGKLTGEMKIINQITFAEVIYDERSLTNWVEDKGYVNVSIVTKSTDTLTKPYFVTANNVRIRNSPSTSDATIIGKASKGQLVGYSSGETINGFIKLYPAKSTGIIYVSKTYLTTDKSKIPADSSSSTNTKSDTSAKVSITVDSETGQKNLNVLGAKVPVDNTSLITYTAITAALVLGFRWLQKKYNG